MSGVTGAIIGGSVITAGASLLGSRDAAKASQRGADLATAEQARQYDQTRADFAPQRELGHGAVNLLARLYGFGPTPQAAATEPQVSRNDQLRLEDLTRRILRSPDRPFPQSPVPTSTEQPALPVTTGRPDLGAFFESPDFQFNLAEGQKAIDRSLAARGRALSGAGVREGERFASGLASQQFGDFTNRLLTIAGLGNAATSATAAAGANAANNAANIIVNNANNRASAYLNRAAGVNNAVQGGIQNYLLYRYLAPGA